MKRVCCVIVSFVSIIAISALVRATPLTDVNVTGTWNMTVEIQSNTSNPVFTLKQEGEVVTGTYKGRLGESPVKGSIKGNEIKLTVKLSVQGQELEINYAGTVEGDTMKGKVKLGDRGEGTFTGKKQ